MKKIVISILVILSIVLISPKFIGNVVEAEYQSAIEKASGNPTVELNNFSFDKGWFGGKATTEVTILLHEEGLDDIKLTVEDNISFGPIIFSDDGIKFALSYSHANIDFSALTVDEEVADFVNDKVHFSGLLTFSKNIVSKIVIDEITKEVDGNKIASSKAVGEFFFDDNKHIYGEFNWDGLSALTNDESFTIGKTQISLDQTLIAGDYYKGDAISVGNFSFIIDSINAKNSSENKVFTLKKVAIAAMSAIDNDLMTVNISYKAGDIKTAGQQLKNANVEMELNRIDIKTMQSVNELMATLSADPDNMFNDANMKKITPLVTQVLAHDPMLQIKDISVETPEGKIQSKMDVLIDKNIFDMNNPMSIIGALKAEANGNAPLPFFAKLGLEPMINMYVEQGILVKDQQALSFKASFSQGQLEVNGKKIPM